MSISERVNAGVALLDQERPGWRDEVSIAHLRMRCESDCILGQVFGSFWRGISVLPLSMESVHEYGFDATPDHDSDLDYEEDEHRAEFDLLQAEWKRVLMGDAL